MDMMAENQIGFKDNLSPVQKIRWGVILLVSSVLSLLLVGVQRLAVGDGAEWLSVRGFTALGIGCFFFFIAVFYFYESTKLLKSNYTRMNQLIHRLAYSEGLLKLVADHQAGAIAIFDRHNRYWFVNQKAAQNIGKDAAAIIGKPPVKVLDNDRATRLELRLAEARTKDNALEWVDEIKNAQGSIGFIQSHYEAIAPFTELTGGVLVSEDDITNLIIERERRASMLHQVINTLIAVVDRRDPYAAGHSARVGQLARCLAEELNLDDKMIDCAEISGSLMNFGKVLVSRSILTKNTALTDEELQRVRDSILTSADILAIIGFETPVVPTLRQVLERYDGSGTPNGLKADGILITARIVTVANGFVALVSPRAHRGGLSIRDAVERMMLDAGKMYDQMVLLALSRYIARDTDRLDWLTANKQS